VPTAEGSEEAAIENQQHIFSAAKIRQAYFVPFEIHQVYIGGGLI